MAKRRELENSGYRFKEEHNDYLHSYYVYENVHKDKKVITFGRC